MTLTIELPDTLAAEFVEQIKTEERKTFSINAIADALALRRKEMDEADARWLAALNAIIDPEKEPERDAAEVRAIIEEGIEELEAGVKLLTLEEVQERWEAQWAARLAAKST